MKVLKPKTTPTGFPVDRSKVVKVEKPKELAIDDLLAWRVKVCYTVERSRWESFKAGTKVNYKPPRSYDGVKAVTIDGEPDGVIESARSSVWHKIVNWCEARKISPVEYVRVCFSGLPMIQMAPEPKQLLGGKYESIWNKLWVQMPEQLALDLEMQKNVARINIVVNQTVYEETPEDAQLLVITDSSLDLSPLFRHCLAKSIDTKQMRKVARTFQAEAVLQFECYPKLYKRVWREVLPPNFAEMADNLYPYVLAKLGMGYKPEEDSTD